MEWIMIIAILLSPLIAVQVTKWIDNKKGEKQRRLDIFRDLMETRAAALTPKHVAALNRIDIEFYNVSKVSEAWKEYHDHLFQASKIDAENKEAWAAWTVKKEDLLTNLLSQMATFLKYNFDNVHIKRGHYHPKAYVDIETELMIIRRALVELLSGRKALNIISYLPEEQLEQLTKWQNRLPPT